MTRATLLMTLGLLTGCAGRDAEPPAATIAARPTGLPLEELPAQTLARGQCALVLWSRTSPPQRLFLAVNEPAAARVRMGGRTLALPRIAATGEAVFGHHPTQTYSGEGVTVTAGAEFDAREGLVGGVAAPSAVLTVRTADGTETVIPAGGLLACQG